MLKLEKMPHIPKKYRVPIILFIVVVFSPILFQVLFICLFNIQALHPVLFPLAHFIQKLFPNKEIFWIAYTGIVTAISIFGAYLLPLINKDIEQREKADELLNALVEEIYVNWLAFSSQTFEVNVSNTVYKEYIRSFRTISSVIDENSIIKLNMLYQKLHVYEFLWKHFYDRNYSFGKREVEDERKMREIAIKTFEQKYQSVVEFLAFFANITDDTKKSLLARSGGLIQGTFQREIDAIVKSNGQSVTRERIKERLITN